MSKNNPASVEFPTDPEQYSYLHADQIRFFEADDGEEKPLRVNFSTVPVDVLYTLSAEENARYMTADQMRRLSGNIKKDGASTSAVLIYPDIGINKLVVLSGNHRVEAAKLAGQNVVPVMVIQNYLTPERRVSIQLSHNAITGQDDPNILGRLYESLSLEYKAYSGLTDDSFNVLEKLDIDSLSLGTPKYEEITLLFLPSEKEVFQKAVEIIDKSKATKTIHLAHYEEFGRLFDALVLVKERNNVFNSAVALRDLVDLAMERLEQLKAEPTHAEET
jgi:ParB-like nuclease domain